jgi:hypothetical protein
MRRDMRHHEVRLYACRYAKLSSAHGMPGDARGMLRYAWGMPGGPRGCLGDAWGMPEGCPGDAWGMPRGILKPHYKKIMLLLSLY